jgi:hypothetical protein
MRTALGVAPSLARLSLFDKELCAMAFIPRQVKPPARIAINCKVPEHLATLLKHYAAFLESSQEHIISETLRVTFRRDKEFQAWLATMHMDLNGRTGDVLPTRQEDERSRKDK